MRSFKTLSLIQNCLIIDSIKSPEMNHTKTGYAASLCFFTGLNLAGTLELCQVSCRTGNLIQFSELVF